MKILFIPIIDPKSQGDYLEMAILHGLRKLLGENFVDYPRKKIMYHDFSDSPKNELHGQGFTMLKKPLEDINRENVLNDRYDAVIYGSGHLRGEKPFDKKICELADNNVWILDGHDLYGNADIKKIYNGEEIIGNQFSKSFKRELIFEEPTVYPTGYGIPEESIMPIDLTRKNKLYQSTYPKHAFFEKPTDLGGNRSHHIFTNENKYYEDLSTSWFGLTSIKGGWDSIRHYEIIAAGTLLLFRDYDLKPKLCSPQNLPCFSYSSKYELKRLMRKLVKKNEPTGEYIKMLEEQRSWLKTFGTTTARAGYVLDVIKSNL